MSQLLKGLLWLLRWLLSEPAKGFIIAVGLIVGAIFIPENGIALFFHHLVRDVGIGILVGVFIVLAMEDTAEKRREEHYDKMETGLRSFETDATKRFHDLGDGLRDAMNQSRHYVYMSVVGAYGPADCLDYLLRSFCSDGFLRRKQFVTLTLRLPSATEKIDLSDDRLIYTINSTFEVHNFAGESKDFAFSTFIEKTKNTNIDEKYVKIQKLKYGNTVLQESDLAAADGGWEDTTLHKRYRRSFPIKAKDALGFDITYQAVKGMRDTMVWSQAMGSDGIDFRLNGPAELEFYAVAYHPSHSLAEAETAQPGHSVRVKVDQAMLARSVVEVWWHPRPLQLVGPAPSAVVAAAVGDF